MGDEYLRSVSGSFDNIRRVLEALPEDYTVFLTADHGGHGRSHGSDMPEDMTIPILCWEKNGESRTLPGGNIIDIAPTVVSLLDVAPDPDWEGKPLAI